MTPYQPRHDRLIIALGDDELEKFVREWALQRKEYTEVERFTGPGDMGRDVVSFLTRQRHEGPWHNYQCKQYGKTLPTSGRVHAAHGLLLRGAARGEPESEASDPEEFRQTLLDRWEEYCADGISEGVHIPLDPTVRALIEKWDFSLIRAISVDIMLSDPAAKPVLVSWFGADPGPPPAGTVPAVTEAREMPYVQQLLDAYGERERRTSLRITRT